MSTLFANSADVLASPTLSKHTVLQRMMTTAQFIHQPQPEGIVWCKSATGQVCHYQLPCPFGNLLLTMQGKVISRCTIQTPDTANTDNKPYPVAPDWLRHSIENWLAGRETQISIYPTGTSFQQKVWQALLRIPAGQVMAYGELARAINKPKSARAIAGACGANPIPWLIPCHRVIAADGSLHGFGLGLPLKATMLKMEFEANPKC